MSISGRTVGLVVLVLWLAILTGVVAVTTLDVAPWERTEERRASEVQLIRCRAAVEDRQSAKNVYTSQVGPIPHTGYAAIQVASWQEAKREASAQWYAAQYEIDKYCR